MVENNPHYIGSGEYEVYYRKFNRDKIYKFVGVCENFCSNGLSAFSNKQTKQMLLIDYSNITGLYPINK